MVSKYSFLKENSKGHLSAYDLNIYLSNTNSTVFLHEKRKEKMVRCTEGKVTYNRLWQLRAPR